MGDLISQLECKPCPCRDCLPGQNTQRAEHGGKDAEFLGIHGKRGFTGHWAPHRRQECRRPLGTSQFKSTQLSEGSRAHTHFPRLSGAYDFDQHGAAQVTLCDFPGGHMAMQLLPCFLDTHTRNPELPRQKSTLCGHQAVKKLIRVESPWKGVCLPVLSARFPSRQQASACTTRQVTRPPARSGRR